MGLFVRLVMTNTTGGGGQEISNFELAGPFSDQQGKLARMEFSFWALFFHSMCYAPATLVDVFRVFNAMYPAERHGDLTACLHSL